VPVELLGHAALASASGCGKIESGEMPTTSLYQGFFAYLAFIASNSRIHSLIRGREVFPPVRLESFRDFTSGG